MKSFVLAMLICQTLQMMAQAPPAASAQSASVAPAGLPLKDLAIAGSTIQAELTRPIDARKNKMGDEVVLKTTQDVNWNGHIVLPKGSKLIGHLTELKVRSKDHGTSELRIAFDRAILKDRTEMPLSLTIQAIGRATIAGEDDLASGSPTVGPGGLLGGIGVALGRGFGEHAGCSAAFCSVVDEPGCRGAARFDTVEGGLGISFDAGFRDQLQLWECSFGQRDRDGPGSKSIAIVALSV